MLSDHKFFLSDVVNKFRKRKHFVDTKSAMSFQTSVRRIRGVRAMQNILFDHLVSIENCVVI